MKDTFSTLVHDASARSFALVALIAADFLLRQGK